MPRRCVAAGCNTKSGMGYSLHGFPQDEVLRKKWVRAGKRQRTGKVLRRVLSCALNTLKTT